MQDKTVSIQEIVFQTKGEGRISSQAPPDESGGEGVKEGEEEGDTKRIKSMGRKIGIGLIISLSAFMFGYCIMEITVIPISEIAVYYNITINQDVALSILIGILPLTAILGAISANLMMKKFRRLSGIYIFTIINCVAIGLVNINMFSTLLVGRGLEGICIGFYSALGPIYLREIAPVELRKLLGLFFSLGKVGGTVFAIILQLILTGAKVSFTYRIILSLTAFLSVLQAVLIFFFGSDTPTEFIEKKQHHKALSVIKNLYKEEYVQEVMQEYIDEVEAAENMNEKNQNEDLKKKGNNQKKEKQEIGEIGGKREKMQLDRSPEKLLNGDITTHQDKKNGKIEAKTAKQKAQSEMRDHELGANQSSISSSSKEVESSADSELVSEAAPQITFQEKKDKAYCLGLNLCAVRNLNGANAIITQAGIFVAVQNQDLGKYTPLIINMIQLLSTFIGVYWITSCMGKKPLFLISLPLMALMNFAVVLALVYDQVIALVLIMSLYMAVNGAWFHNPIWAYPSEIIPASEALPMNILHWFTLAICMLVPPLISGINNGNPYPVFIFFGLYSFIGFVHVRWTLRESDGLSYRQIIHSFK